MHGKQTLFLSFLNDAAMAMWRCNVDARLFTRRLSDTDPTDYSSVWPTMSEQKITIRLLYFASVREATSKSEEQIQIPANTTCAQLLVRLSTSYPSLLSMMADLSTAVNEKYVDTNTVLKDRDTVAVMPPISGG